MKMYIKQKTRVELRYKKSIFGQCNELVTKVIPIGEQ